MGNPEGNPLKRIVREVHRRSLWQVLAIYVAASWVVFEVVETLTDGLGLPGWFPGFAFVLLLIGLPVVLATAFVQEGGPGTAGSDAPLIDVTGREIERRETGSGSAGPADRLFTWRNAMLGGIGALALWGVVATGWILFGGGPPSDASDPSSSRPSLAVLPFDNLSPDPDNAYFAAGIHEEMLTRLSKVEDLSLRGRTSVMQYQDSRKDLQEIGRELRARYILEGSVQRVGDQVRITAQLINAEQDEHLWAERYDRELTDIFRIQTDVATRVVEELKGVLGPDEQAELAGRPTDDMEAYAYYLRGHERVWNLPNEADLRAAIEAYRRAVELDPSFAAAWARLVQARLFLAWNHQIYDQHARARAALERVEQLAPGSPELRLGRGIWLYYGVQRYEEALREFDALAELWPGNVDVMRFQSLLYRRVGRWEDAIRTMERILELDPADVRWRVTISQTYNQMRRFEEAERYGEMAVSLDPTVPSHWWWLSWVHMSRGDTAAARRTLASARRHLDDETIESGWAWGFLHFYTGGTEEVLEFYLDQQPFPSYGIPDLGLAVAAANGRDDLVRLFADTLQGWSRNALSSIPAEYAVARSRELSYSALAQAYLGNEEEAVRLAREAVEIYPESRDAYFGARRVRWRAEVLTVVGRHEEAVDRLRFLLSIPAHQATVPMLRMDPRWDPLRDRPDFQALLTEGG